MSLELIIGPMFSGKSCEILRHIRMLKVLKKKYIVVKPSIDTRYDENMIVSHNMDKEPCTRLKHLNNIYDINKDIFDGVDTILIDEGQFFDDLHVVVKKLIENNNKNVIVAGLIGDYNRQKFGQILDLMPFCDLDKIKLLTALCVNCMDGTSASFSHRTNISNEQILIGESDMYSSICRKHYSELKNICHKDIDTQLFRLSKGPAAANIYHGTISQLTIDWSYDAVYFKYENNDSIILSLGPCTSVHDIGKINTPNMITEFKSLYIYALNNLNGYSGNSDKALVVLGRVVDLFI
jgi:thymidine kinase